MGISNKVYRIDETAPPALRTRLLRHLQRGKDPDRLPATLACHFRREGDGFFGYYKEPLQPLRTKRTQPAEVLAEPPAGAPNGIRQPDVSIALKRLQKMCGEAVYQSAEDFENRREHVEWMLQKLRMLPDDAAVAWHVFRLFFSLHPGQWVGFSLVNRTGLVGLKPYEVQVLAADRTADATWTPILLYVTADGVHINNPTSDPGYIHPDARLRHPVLRIRWENLKEDTLKKLTFLDSVTAENVVSGLPPYIVQDYKQEL